METMLVIPPELQDIWVDISSIFKFSAPEVMCRMDHSVVADYYALGVITYELMLGRVL
jgi:hypothetical protein